MAVKIDKEVLIKHHFWILTGLCVLLVLIPLFCLIGGVSGTVTKEAETMANSKKKAQAITSSVPKNEKWVTAYKKQDEIVDARRIVVWKQASVTQRDFMTWPESLLSEYPSFRTKQFGDPITPDEADKWGQLYNTQLRSVLVKVQPLESRDFPLRENYVFVKSDDDRIVQFKGDSWNGVLNLYHEFRHDATPTHEDVWLAQEDLWVKRELLLVVRAANDALAQFKEVKAEPPPQTKTAPDKEAKEAKDIKEPSAAPDKKAKDAKSAKVPARAARAPEPDRNHKVFRNYFWEMELTLSRGPRQKYLLSGKITNIGKRRQPLGAFRIYLDDSEGSVPTILALENEPLAVGQSYPFKDREVDNDVSIHGLHGVEQVLNWQTAAVKRIDDLRIDYQSSRLASRALVQPRWVEKPAAADAAAAPGAVPGTAPGTAPAGLPGQERMMGAGGPGSTMLGFGSNAGQGLTKNGFTLARYFDTNEQVRHMPVAMVVVVDEDFIHEFLGAFANCRLRIQTLQCHWHHIREKIKPQSETVTAAESEKGGKGNPAAAKRPPADKGEAIMGMQMPGGNPNERMRGRGGMPMMGAGPGMTMGGGRLITQQNEDQEEADMNLVELAVYGLASIYENPAKPAAATADATAPKCNLSLVIGHSQTRMTNDQLNSSKANDPNIENLSSVFKEENSHDVERLRHQAIHAQARRMGRAGRRRRHHAAGVRHRRHEHLHERQRQGQRRGHQQAGQRCRYQDHPERPSRGRR